MIISRSPSMTEECELLRVCPGVNVGHQDLRTDTAKNDSVVDLHGILTHPAQ